MMSELNVCKLNMALKTAYMFNDNFHFDNKGLCWINNDGTKFHFDGLTVESVGKFLAFLDETKQNLSYLRFNCNDYDIAIDRKNNVKKLDDNTPYFHISHGNNYKLCIDNGRLVEKHELQNIVSISPSNYTKLGDYDKKTFGDLITENYENALRCCQSVWRSRDKYLDQDINTDKIVKACDGKHYYVRVYQKAFSQIAMETYPLNITYDNKQQLCKSIDEYEALEQKVNASRKAHEEYSARVKKIELEEKHAKMFESSLNQIKINLNEHKQKLKRHELSKAVVFEPIHKQINGFKFQVKCEDDLTLEVIQDNDELMKLFMDIWNCTSYWEFRSKHLVIPIGSSLIKKLYAMSDVDREFELVKHNIFDI